MSSMIQYEIVIKQQMKSKNQLQYEEDVDTLESYRSMNYDDKTMEVVQYRKENFFQFGSSILAVLYMANTMLIPNMNQLFIEISFDNPLKMIISVIVYWLLSFLILIPCYLVIQICKQEGNPIYAHIIKQDSINIYKAFIYCNLIINTLGLFNIIVRLGDSLPKVNRWFYVEFHDLMASEQGKLFFPTIICYSAVVLLLFCSFYKFSYFEHYYDIQYRLIISFVGKLFLNTLIFIFIYYEVPDASQEYIQMDENLFDPEKSEKASDWIIYSFNQICCISYPFFEVFYLKRETKKGYAKVQQCYWIQWLLRSVIFFYQITTWGIIISQQKMKYYYQPLLQSLNSLLIFLISISITSIYSHNYTLNKELLQDNIQTATEKDNKKQIKQIYMIAAGIFVFEICICIICRRFIQNFTVPQIKSFIFSLTYSVQTICFGFSCISIPVYLWIKNFDPQSNMFKGMAYSVIIVYMIIFIVISSEPFFQLKQ
ncbi:unnamed protein product [Paramecium sonneborni]|uniref:Uncharacterized protein n=1 Tax=Paramecium sonneborni TaxID=65129 RepID=A0A8S1NW88_9CILI|nr:unnamed protein product [Paramecium sonneborni]